MHTLQFNLLWLPATCRRAAAAHTICPHLSHSAGLVAFLSPAAFLVNWTCLDVDTVSQVGSRNLTTPLGKRNESPRHQSDVPVWFFGLLLSILFFFFFFFFAPLSVATLAAFVEPTSHTEPEGKAAHQVPLGRTSPGQLVRHCFNTDNGEQHIESAIDELGRRWASGLPT